MKSKIAIVLGGTLPHVQLIIKLHEQGYYVVLIDYLPNPPGKYVADEHIQASTLDKECVLSIAKEREACLVISSCIDQANSVCCYVAEKLNLPHPYSYETSLLVTNKGLMKARMKANNIPSSSYILTHGVSDIDWSHVKLPCVVKPVDCNSSKGVHRADSIEEAKSFVDKAIQLSQTATAIIEDFCPGDEIQVDCIALNGDVRVIMTRSKVKVVEENGSVLNSFGSIVPAQISDKMLLQINEIAKNITKGFGLYNTPFFYQAIVNGDTINVLEFAPRIGGGLSYYMLKNFVGFDAITASINSFLGVPIKDSFHSLTKFYRSCLLYSQPCIFDHIDGLEELKNAGIIKEYFITKVTGDILDGDMRSSNRVGSFIVESSSVELLQDLVAICMERISIIDINGDNKILTSFQK